MYTQSLNCPQCSKPLHAFIEQIFDYYVNPSALNLLFDESVNSIHCEQCGFYGRIAVPIIYHDPDKELLLTFVPSELGISRDEQEKIIGNLIKNIIEILPNEKRKAYLLNPQTFFTYESLIDKLDQIYDLKKDNEDTIKQKFDLLRKLIEADSLELFDEIVQKEKEQIDEELFIQLSQVIEQFSRNESSPDILKSLEIKYNRLLSNTEIGKKLLSEMNEIKEVDRLLEQAGDHLNREKLLEIAINSADSENKLVYLVGNTRPLMDYMFFQILSDKILSAKGNEQQKLMDLRTKLLSETEKIDNEVEKLRLQAKSNFEKMIQASDIESIVLQNLPLINNFFLERLAYELAEARRTGDKLKEEKINKMQGIINKIIVPTKAQFFMELINQPDEAAIKNYINNNHIIVDNNFIEYLEKVRESISKDVSQEINNKVNMVINVAKSMHQ